MNAPTEKLTTTLIIRDDLDFNSDLENMLITDDQNWILAMTVVVASLILLLNYLGW